MFPEIFIKSDLGVLSNETGDRRQETGDRRLRTEDCGLRTGDLLMPEYIEHCQQQTTNNESLA
jgi:hypothetical protein